MFNFTVEFWDLVYAPNWVSICYALAETLLTATHYFFASQYFRTSLMFKYAFMTRRPTVEKEIKRKTFMLNMMDFLIFLVFVVQFFTIGSSNSFLYWFGIAIFGASTILIAILSTVSFIKIKRYTDELKLRDISRSGQVLKIQIIFFILMLVFYAPIPLIGVITGFKTELYLSNENASEEQRQNTILWSTVNNLIYDSGL